MIIEEVTTLLASANRELDAMGEGDHSFHNEAAFYAHLEEYENLRDGLVDFLLFLDEDTPIKFSELRNQYVFNATPK